MSPRTSSKRQAEDHGMDDDSQRCCAILDGLRELVTNDAGEIGNSDELGGWIQILMDLVLQTPPQHVYDSQETDFV